MSSTEEMEYRAAHPKCVRIYDINFDEFRDITQRDVDLLQRAATNWGSTKKGVEELAASVAGLHERYMINVRSVNGNAGGSE